jgi:CRISPR/Cas system-associated protein Csx1
MILFLSNRAIVNLHLFDFYYNNALFQLEYSFKEFIPVLLTTVGIFTGVFTVSSLLFRRTQLK